MVEPESTNRYRRNVQGRTSYKHLRACARTGTRNSSDGRAVAASSNGADHRTE